MENNQKFMPLDIQRFADDTGDGQGTPINNNVPNNNTSSAQAPSIDYDKIQGMIDSRNQKTEDNVLKSYFQSQGMSEEEMKQAISSFKTQREENNKNQLSEANTLKESLDKANSKALLNEIEKEAVLQALELNVDSKSIPYVVKLADFSNVSDENGAINSESIKSAMQKVLEDVPALKKASPNLGDLQIGADGSQSSESNLDSTLSRVFGTKK